MVLVVLSLYNTIVEHVLNLTRGPKKRRAGNPKAAWEGGSKCGSSVPTFLKEQV